MEREPEGSTGEQNLANPLAGSRSRRRIVLLGVAHQHAITDHKAITAGLTFLFAKEIALQNVLLEGFAEMEFVCRQFESGQNAILQEGTPELPGYIDEINQLSEQNHPDIVIELHVVELSISFKSFLLLAKGVLDKLVPLYSYKYGGDLRQFSNKGERLVRVIRGGKSPRKSELIKLIHGAKVEWIDTLIDMRDEYAHYSTLSAYQNFWISGSTESRAPLQGIADFNRPSIEIGEQHVEALEYIKGTKRRMITFLNEFLLLCEFTPGRRPKRYLKCEDCGRAFATRGQDSRISLTDGSLEIRVKDRALDYGVIVCSVCRGETDTDIGWWRDELGLAVSSTPAAHDDIKPEANP